MQYTLHTVTAPTYAVDGSRGYFLTVGWSAMVTNPVDGPHRHTGTLPGWVDRTADGRVIATIDGGGWQYVTDTPVADADWSDAWVWSHGSDIIEAATR